MNFILYVLYRMLGVTKKQFHIFSAIGFIFICLAIPVFSSFDELFHLNAHRHDLNTNESPASSNARVVFSINTAESEIWNQNMTSQYSKMTKNASLSVIFNNSPLIFGTSGLNFVHQRYYINFTNLLYMGSALILINAIIYSTRKHNSADEQKSSIYGSYPQYIKSITQTGVSNLQTLIFDLILSNPGIHFAKICETLHRENGVVQYHIQNLEQSENLIMSHKDGGFHRYFPNICLFHDSFTRIVLSEIFHQTSANVLQNLWNSDIPLTNKNLREEIGVSRQHISKNCQVLVEKGIIHQNKQGRELVYNLSEAALLVFNFYFKIR